MSTPEFEVTLRKAMISARNATVKQIEKDINDWVEADDIDHDYGALVTYIRLMLKSMHIDWDGALV